MIWPKLYEKNKLIELFQCLLKLRKQLCQYSSFLISYNYIIHLYLIIFNFFAFPLFKWNFYIRLEGVPISYPQLLLNLWVDFNENFRHSSTYIGDVHLYKCYMRFDYFQLFWFPILKNGFCHTILEGYPSLIHYPSLTCEWISMKHV